MGCLLMALGGLLAVTDRRYRSRQRSLQGRPTVKRYLLPLVCFVILVGFLAVGLRLKPREVPSPLVNKPVPVFRLPTLADPNQQLSPQDLRGKVWILNVWASWCVACREEHPVLVDFAKAGLVPLYGLNYKDKRPDAQAWLAKFGNPYATLAV